MQLGPGEEGSVRRVGNGAVGRGGGRAGRGWKSGVGGGVWQGWQRKVGRREGTLVLVLVLVFELTTLRRGCSCRKRAPGGPPLEDLQGDDERRAKGLTDFERLGAAKFAETSRCNSLRKVARCRRH